MIPAQLDYVRPGSLDEALRILADREGEAKLLSGGYSLIPLIKLRLAQPALLVDMQAISGLDGIEETDTHLVIGARATHRQVNEAPVVVAKYPLLRDVAGGIGDPQVRNWGTIGGSIAHADPASDWPAALIAASATIVCRGTAGTREIDARGFFLDTFTTALDSTEILTEVRIGRRTAGTGGAYEKLERKVGDFATAGVAAVIRIDASGAILGAGIGVTGVSASPYAARDAEATLAGSRPSDETFRAAGAAAAADSEPVSDVRGPAAYKRAMVAELTVRALRRATQRALTFNG